MADQIYKVRDPSGNIREIKGPEGASDEEIIAQAQQLFEQPAAPTKTKEPELSTGQRIATGAAKGGFGYLGALIGAGNEAVSIGNEALTKNAYDAGGRVTDIAANAGIPPGGAAALGLGTNATLQAGIPLAVGKAASGLVAPAMEGAGKFLMRSAINAPLKDRLSGNAERAVETMLQKGYNPTIGGKDSMREAARELNKQVTGIADNSQNAMNPNSLYPAIREKLQKANIPGDIATDTKAIRNVWEEFVGSVNNPLSVKEAQTLKQDIYKSLGDKSYGIKSSEESAKETAQKALARALKEKIAELEPSTAPLLKEQSDLLNAARLAERRAGTDQGLKVTGLAPIAPTTGRMLAMLLDKYTLLKSVAARGLYSGAERIPQAGAGTTAALGQGLLGRKQREEDERRAALAAALNQGQQ